MQDGGWKMNAGRKKRIKSIIAVCLMVLLLGTMMPEGKKAAAEEMNANFLKEVQAHNVTENADYTLQHSKGRGISQNLRTFTYQPPEVSISYEFSNVAEMKAADFAALGIAEGDYVRTEGYYSAGDGGGGVYRIQNDVIIRDDGEKILDDGGQIIACEHQLNKKNMRAALQTQDGIISAAQYGAVGDGKTDDSEALEKAFSSNFSVIYLEKGKEYRCGSTIWVNKIKDMTIEGQGATLFADNDSVGEWKRLLILFGPENYHVKNIRFELRCTKYISMTGLADMYNGDNFGFDHCEFYIPKGVYADSEVEEPTKTYASCCLGGVSNWNNIYINNCIIENYADTYTGGCIGFNDIWYQGSQKALVDNCYMAYNCKDEVIAIFSGAGYESENETFIKDITVKNCDIYGLAGQYNRDLLLSIGYEYPVDNIQFINNHIEGYGVWKGISIGSGAGTVLLEGNEIVYSGLSEKAEGNVINTGTGENKSVTIRNNKILVPKTSANLSILIAGEGEVSGNQIRCDAGTGYVMGYGTNAVDNQVMLNGTTYGLMCQKFQSIRNQFVVNGECKGNSLYSVKETLKTNVVIDSDSVSLNGGVADSVKWMNALTVNKVTFNGNEVQFTNNTVKADSLNDKQFCFFGYYPNTEQDAAQITIANNNMDSALSSMAGDVTDIDVSFKNNKIEDIPVYLVNFIANGKASNSSKLVLSGKTVTLPKLKNDTETLLGWYKDKGFKNEFDATTPITSNTTLYARWTGDNVVEEEEEEGENTEEPSTPPFTEEDIVDNKGENQEENQENQQDENSGKDDVKKEEEDDSQNQETSNTSKPEENTPVEETPNTSKSEENTPVEETPNTSKPEESKPVEETPNTNKTQETTTSQVTQNTNRPTKTPATQITQSSNKTNSTVAVNNQSNNTSTSSSNEEFVLDSDVAKNETQKEYIETVNNEEKDAEVLVSKDSNADINQKNESEKTEYQTEESLNAKDVTKEEDVETLEKEQDTNQKLIIGIICLAGVLSFGVLFYAFILIKRGKL